MNTMNTMKLLENQIKQAFNNKDIKDIQYSTQVINTTTLESIKKELGDTKFTLKETLTYLETFTTNTSLHTTLICGPITINVLTKNIKDIPPRLLLIRIIKRLYIVYNLFKINKQFKFWLIPTDVNKWFPKKGIVTPKHVNGGFTYITNDAYTSIANIYIYRREEFPKVMLHELMHHSYIDTSNNPKFNNNFINKLKIICDIDNNTSFLPNEGIVEGWALILQLLFISYEYNIPFSVIINIEQKWSAKQTARLLFYKNNRSNDYKDYKTDNDWEETSNSYCYFVIKTFLISNIDNFITNTYNNTLDTYLLANFENYLSKIKQKQMHNSCFRMSVFGDL